MTTEPPVSGSSHRPTPRRKPLRAGVQAARCVVSVLVVMLIRSGDAIACSCAPISPEQARDLADAIFIGSVERFQTRGEPTAVHVPGGTPSVVHRAGREATFRVSTVWKGPVQPELTILTGEGGGDCGVDFVVGREYLVYARQGATNICARTQEVWFHPERAADDVAILGAGQPAAPMPAPEAQ